MNLLDDFELEFTEKKIPLIIHKWNASFKPEKKGFIPTDKNKISFFKNIKGETYYYIRRFEYDPKWIFKIITSDKKIIMNEIINDIDIETKLKIIFRSDIIKDI